ncbi:MAG: sulfotransferase [Actinomycetota bacterium]
MPSFFIVGSARSGTTMLRLMLNAHPEVAVPPESRFIVELWHHRNLVRVDSFLDELGAHKQFRAWNLGTEAVRRELPGTPTVAYSEAVDAPYKAYARERSKPSWGDKTPRYIEHIPFLAERFPEARFIHVVRDGRNVALSYADVPFGPKTVARAAELWARRVRLGLEAGRSLAPDRLLELRYEEMVADEDALTAAAKTICAFLGIGFDDALLNYGELSRPELLDKAKDLNPLVMEGPVAKTRSWQEQMAPHHVEVFELVAGDTLSELGYPRMFPEPGVRAHVVAALGRKRIPVGRLKRAQRAAARPTP